MKNKPCGRNFCCVATGIHEGLTFGYGRLDDHGFWKYPCNICARAWEKDHPKDGECWPVNPIKELTSKLLLGMMLTGK